MQHRVVITGLGTVNPTGLTVAESWDNIVNGRTGIMYCRKSSVRFVMCRSPVVGSISARKR